MAIDAKRTVPGYGLDCPTEQDLLKGLTKFMDQGAAEQTWDAACRQRGVRRPIAQQRHDQLLSVAEGLVSEVQGLAQIALRNVIVKCRNYALLAKETR